MDTAARPVSLCQPIKTLLKANNRPSLSLQPTERKCTKQDANNTIRLSSTGPHYCGYLIVSTGGPFKLPSASIVKYPLRLEKRWNSSSALTAVRLWRELNNPRAHHLASRLRDASVAGRT